MQSQAFNTAKGPTLKLKNSIFTYWYPAMRAIIIRFFFSMRLTEHNASKVSPCSMYLTKVFLPDLLDFFSPEGDSITFFLHYWPHQSLQKAPLSLLPLPELRIEAGRPFP